VSEGRVLIVDDDLSFRRVVRTMMAAKGYEVSEARNGTEALEHVRAAKYDLLLLDINMPEMTGVEVCREIRKTSEVPIIMLTVRNTESDKVEALDAGADDYITKPFGARELLARIRAALRRAGTTLEQGVQKLRLGDVEIDFSSRQVRARNAEVRLTSKEFDLLFYFATHPNKTMTHRELLQAIWGPDYGDEQEYLRVFINRLRKKIERLPKNPKYLITEPWVGYRLRVPQ
jgi:two-component system, OmpR family, KDP operon response regulator KdpE